MSQPEPARSSHLDLSTLIIAAIASCAAAYVTSRFWQGGTLWSATLTPVIVALVKEALARPADKLQSSTRLVRDKTTGRPRDEVPVGGSRGSAEPPQPKAPHSAPPRLDDPDTEYSGVQVYSSRKPAGKHWTLAIGTGLLAFVIAAVVVTVPELVANGSSGDGGGRQGTTFFGGRSSRSSSSKQDTKDKAKTPVPGADATPTPAPRASPTPTPTPRTQATPSATPTPTPSPAARATEAPTP